MSRARTSGLQNTIAKMLLHEHTLIANKDEPGEIFCGYDTDHQPPQFYFVLNTVTDGYNKFTTPRAAAAEFIRSAGTATARGAVLNAQAEAKAYNRGRGERVLSRPRGITDLWALRGESNPYKKR